MLIDELKIDAPLLSVGALTADWMNLASELALLDQAGVRLLHVDVMDGLVWPKITVGSSYVAGLKTTLLKDVHLLIDKPENHIESFAKAGADMITFSVETCGDNGQTLRRIGKFKNVNDPSTSILRGVSLNPETPVDHIASVIDDVDIVLLLAVSPDPRAGSCFSSLPARIAEVKQLKGEALVFIDGGIKVDNIGEVVAMEPDVIVTGSAVFDGKAPAENLKCLMEKTNG
jgi:ribulose-phosphate 3-epimerase